MASKLPYIQFYPGDWLRDAVSGCSLAAQGLWLRLLIVAHDSEKYGYLQQGGFCLDFACLARRCGCDLEQFTELLSELRSAGVFGTTEDGIIYSRRMARDASLREIRSKAGRKGGKQTAKQKSSKRQANTQAKPKQNPEYEDEYEDLLRDSIPEVLRTDDFKKTFADWLRYKTERRERYKPTGLAAVISTAAKRATRHGVSAVVEAMQTAMTNGWAGWDQKSTFGGTNGQPNKTGWGNGPGQRYRGPVD